MATMRDNATRVKRFRELKTTWRTNRERLLVGLDIAQAEHVVHVRHAHTRVVTAELLIPNTTRGFAQLWARIQRATGCREVVCGREPTGTSHEAEATFLEGQGADVLPRLQRRGLLEPPHSGRDWDEQDRKDAANCADLLEQGKVRFSTGPAGSLPSPQADHTPASLRADGGAAPKSPARRAARGPTGLGAGGPRAARRPDGTTTMGRERSPGSGP